METFQLPKQHYLPKYLRSLATHKDQFLSLTAGQVLQLDPDVSFPLTLLSQLVVRRCYLDMLEADARHRQLKPSTTLTYMTGTNGCGKSCCAAIHMSKLLAEGKTVIFEPCDGVHASTRQLFKLRLGDPVTTAPDPGAFITELADADVCYIVDGGLPSARYFEARCWAYTSPRAMSTRALKYVFACSHVMKMPCFSLDELLQLRRGVGVFRERVPEDWVRAFHHLAGGNAMLVLELPAFRGLELRGMEALLRREVFGLDWGQIQAMHVHGTYVGSTTDACDCLLQWEVIEEEDEEEGMPRRCGARSSSPEEEGLRHFQHHRLQFASAFVAALVARHQTLDMRQLCTRVTQRLPSAAAGSQFDRLVHSTLPNMPAGAPQLKLKLLASGREFLLQLQASEPRLFYSAVEAAELACPDCKTYLMPCSGPAPAADCLLSSKLMLKVAPGSSHTISRAGLEELCTAVKADEDKFGAAHAALEQMLSAVGRRKKRPLKANLPLLVFVTPETQYQKWEGLQQYTDPQPQAPLVEQAVLCFPTHWAVEVFPRC